MIKKTHLVKSSITLFIVLLFSCQHKNAEFLNELDSKLNVFNISITPYKFEKNQIYKMDIPDLNSYSSFSKNNYFVNRNKRILVFTIYENCIEEYKKGNYKINFSLNEKDFNTYNPCDVNLIPIIDFSLREGEKLYYYRDHYILLQKKFFDNEIKDSVYKFCRIWRDTSKPTVIFATKKNGFIGVYDSIKKKDTMINPYGRFYKSETKSINIVRNAPKIDIAILKKIIGD